jgi:acyl-CoA reductase-like NAD-dependent aldehyde dehydrogenase
MTPEQKQEKRIYVAIDRALAHVPGITPKDIHQAVDAAVRAFKQGEEAKAPVRRGLLDLFFKGAR